MGVLASLQGEVGHFAWLCAWRGDEGKGTWKAQPLACFPVLPLGTIPTGLGLGWASERLGDLGRVTS